MVNFLFSRWNRYSYDGEIKIGEKYLQSFEWEAYEVPFREVKIDTIQVLDMKNGYIKYKIYPWKSEFVSMEEKIFRSTIKGIE